ncbi:MAG: hypothetical protein ACKVWV_04555 [Planctomycetota bacterium]
MDPPILQEFVVKVMRTVSAPPTFNTGCRKQQLSEKALVPRADGSP